MKNIALIVGFNTIYEIMMIRGSDLLFWATLYIYFLEHHSNIETARLI